MSATMGHNKPAPMTPEEVSEWLADTCADLSKRQQEILAGAQRFHDLYETIPDEEVQGKAADFAGGKGAIAAFLKLSESRRISEKQPFDRAATAVQGFFKRLVEPVEIAQRDIRTKMNAYAARQEEIRRAEARRQAEEAAALARQAEAAALKNMTSSSLETAEHAAKAAEKAEQKATAPAAELTRTTGALGTTVSVHTTWKFHEEESDLMALAKAVVEGRAPLVYLAFNSVRIGLAVRTEKVRQIPGCIIREERNVR